MPADGLPEVSPRADSPEADVQSKGWQNASGLLIDVQFTLFIASYRAITTLRW